MPAGRFPLTASCVLLLVGVGCATLVPLPHAAHPGAGVQPIEDGYEDHAGVIHIHTVYSDGAGTFEEIARIANAQRLDYLIVTDHNTLQPLRDGKQGWYGGTLVLVGAEISTRGGHYLALGITEEIDHHKLTTQQIIDEVTRQGGVGIIAHPYFKKRRWTDWTVTGFTGIEAYNVAHDTLDENRARLVFWTLGSTPETFYFSILDRPYDPLAMWDRLLARHPGPPSGPKAGAGGRITGIGASDAHEVRVLGMKFAPYDIMFRLIRTHLLTPPGPLTAEAIYDALRQGHAYLGIELIAEVKGFTFLAEDGKRQLGIMGDAVPLVHDLRLRATLPAAAQLVLFHNGGPIAETTADTWEVPVTAPGAYRLEASRHSKPWIISNPIYVQPAQ